MVEKGTRIKDSSVGDVIATRDAHEPDETGEIRVVQLVDLASRQHNMITVRGVSQNVVSSNDPINLDQMYDFWENMIDAGDKSLLVVKVEHSNNNGSAAITPIVMNDEIGRKKITLNTGDNDAICSLEYDGMIYSVGMTSPNLLVGTDGGDGPYTEWRTCIRFQLGIPPGSQIVDARIRLYALNMPNNPKNVTVGHWRGNSDNMPSAEAFYNDEMWGGWSDPIMQLGSSEQDQYFEIPCTSAIQGAVNDPAYETWDQWPLLLKQADPLDNNPPSRYRSANYSSNHPELVVSWIELDGCTILETKVAAVDTNAPLYRGSTYLSPILTWPLNGSRKINLHVNNLSSANGIRIKAGVI